MTLGLLFILLIFLRLIFIYRMSVEQEKVHGFPFPLSFHIFDQSMYPMILIFSCMFVYFLETKINLNDEIFQNINEHLQLKVEIYQNIET